MILTAEPESLCLLVSFESFPKLPKRLRMQTRTFAHILINANDQAWMLRVIENYATLSELTKALANRCAQTVPRRSPDGPQTVPRRSPAEKHTVPDHFKIHKGRFPNPFLIILKWSGTVCFFAGDRLGTVWGPSGHRCRLEFRNIYARNSPVRTKALTFTPLLTSFGCSKIPPSDHIDNLDAKHDGSHITRMTRMLNEQQHPTVSDHLDETVYRLLTHIFVIYFFSGGCWNKLRKCWEAGNVLPVCSFETNNTHLSF